MCQTAASWPQYFLNTCQRLSTSYKAKLVLIVRQVMGCPGTIV